MADSDVSRMRMEIEEAVSACMAGLGFRYIAWGEDASVQDVDVDPSIGSDSREYAQIYGFGISTQFYAQRDVGENLRGFASDGSGVVVKANPNDQLREALAVDDRERYDKALWGSSSSKESDPSEGCAGSSKFVAYPDGGAFIRAFGRQLTDLVASVDSDSEFQEYVRSVDQCVNAKLLTDVSIANLTEIYEHFDQALFELDEGVPGNPFRELAPSELAAMSQAELDLLYDVPRVLSFENKSQLSLIQREEITLATTVWDCGGGPLSRSDVRRRVQRRLEQHFLDDYATEVAPFRGQK